MARTKKQVEKPNGGYTIYFYENRVEVEIHDFEKLNPRKIQQSVDFVQREWQRLKQEALRDSRRQSDGTATTAAE